MNTPTIHFARKDESVTVFPQNEFLRHGEWLFVPAPGLVVEASRIRRQAPLQAGAPLVEELYRTGGEAAWHSPSQNCVLTVPQFRRLLRQRPAAAREDWRIVQRAMSVYARGMVRCPQNGPLTLRGWHRILMNTEHKAPAMRHMAFLD
jgi:hypothetical protein